MSKFYSSAGFKGFNKNESIPVTTKVSQKELKKQKKTGKQNGLNNTNPNANPDVNLGITDEEFEKMMEENEPTSYTNGQTNPPQNLELNQYKIPENYDSEKAHIIISSGLEGEELVQSIKSDPNPISGLDLIRGLVEKFSEPEQITWINPNKYGLALKYLFENNQQNQVLCLLVLENFAKSKGFVKVPYKNSQVYHIRLLFQLFLTWEIIDEEAFWEWQDYLEKNTHHDEKTSNTLVIQTAEFYLILKTVFEDDEEKGQDDNQDKLEINNPNRPYGLNNNQDNTNESEPEPDSDNDKYIVPEEQDYNLDDL